jgi:malonyl-CoA/methylmalonyl-CoA synthetase
MNQDRVAVATPDGTYTYADLDRESRAVAGALLDSALDLNEARVAFFIPPGCEYAAVLRGIWRAGGVAVPLALSHPAPELAYVLGDSGATFVVGTPPSRDRLAPIAEKMGVRFLTSVDVLAHPVRNELPHVGTPRRAMIVYTSGTTGRPKGVVTTHAILGAEIGAMVEAWEWRPSDRMLLSLPLHHAHGIMNGLLAPLAVHATCEILPAFDAAAVWERFGSGEITVFTAVPTIYHRLIAAWDEASADTQKAWSAGARRARLMMSGSAALPVQILARWRDITGHTLLERYGMTETGMILSNPLHGERRPGYVGTPMPGVEVRVVDESGNAVPDGTPGEIETRGPLVFLEYWGRPEETRAAFRDGWFQTGDTAVHENGSYRLLGRSSVDIIKTGGFKVSALQIEEVLRMHPAVAECAVVGVADEEWGERVAAAIELRPSATLALPELQQWAKSRLAPYKVPRLLRTLETLPRNAVGKVVKPDVAALFASNHPG